jgi:hypothetical protein
MDQQTQPSPQLADERQPKRDYRAPRVLVHGTVADLTQAAKTAGIPDSDSAGSHVSDLL